MMMFESLHKYKAVFIVLLAICFVMPDGWSTTFYVSKSGSNSNDGSQSDPWLTIQKAADNMGAGDKVIVSTGTYNERVGTKADGNAENNIIYQASGDVTVNGFLVENSYIDIDGFRINGSGIPAYNGAVHIEYDVEYIMVQNNTIGGMDWQSHVRGIRCVREGRTPSGGPDHITIRKNQIGTCGSDAILLNGTNNLIEENSFTFNNGWDGIRLWGSDIIIRYNIFDNVSKLEGNGNHPDIVQTFGPNECYNVIFERNLSMNCTNQGIRMKTKILGTKMDNFTIRYNIFIGFRGATLMCINDDIKVYNNVFWECTQNTAHPVGFTEDSFADGNGGSGTNGVCKNNIFIGCGSYPEAQNCGWFGATEGEVMDTFTHDYNYVASNTASGYAPKYSSRSDPNREFTDEHGINGGDPMFFNPNDPLGPDGILWTADDGFRLTTGSAAIGAGEDGKDLGPYVSTGGDDDEGPNPPQNLRIED